MHNLPRLAVLLACTGICGGCLVAAGAAGGLAAVKYLNNQAVREYRTDVRTAYEATLAVLPELGYPSPSKSVFGPSEAEIDAGNAEVAIAEFPNGMVRVAVSVGTFETSEHRRRAALIHDRLAVWLGARVAPPAR